MRSAILASLALMISAPTFAQSANPFFQQDYRDRAAGYVETDRARDEFAIAHQRAADGNYLGAAVAQERGRIARSRADADVRAADRDRLLGRVTE